MAKTPAQLDREIAEALTGNAQRTARVTVAGARVAKTKLIHVVQGNYGYGHGWEDVTAEDHTEAVRIAERVLRWAEALIGPARA